MEDKPNSFLVQRSQYIFSFRLENWCSIAMLSQTHYRSRYEQLKEFTARTSILKMTFADVKALFEYCSQERRGEPPPALKDVRLFVMMDPLRRAAGL